VRLLWTIVRILVLLAALATLLLTVLFVSSPSGTSVDTNGAIIDGIALVIFVLVAWSLWRDRHSLV
jgi:hypothetical protein